jgi:hypothetical protein
MTVDVDASVDVDGANPAMNAAVGPAVDVGLDPTVDTAVDPA